MYFFIRKLFFLVHFQRFTMEKFRKVNSSKNIKAYFMTLLIIDMWQE